MLWLRLTLAAALSVWEAPGRDTAAPPSLQRAPGARPGGLAALRGGRQDRGHNPVRCSLRSSGLILWRGHRAADSLRPRALGSALRAVPAPGGTASRPGLVASRTGATEAGTRGESGQHRGFVQVYSAALSRRPVVRRAAKGFGLPDTQRAARRTARWVGQVSIRTAVYYAPTWANRT